MEKAIGSKKPKSHNHKCRRTEGLRSRRYRQRKKRIHDSKRES